MSAERFLDRVEQTGLLDAAELAKLRKQIGASAFRVTSEAVAEMRVQDGHLTESEASKLLAQAAAAQQCGATQATGSNKTKRTTHLTGP